MWRYLRVKCICKHCWLQVSAIPCLDPKWMQELSQLVQLDFNKHITFCKNANGSKHQLGAGSFGTVGLVLLYVPATSYFPSMAADCALATTC
jgi:hypothetical protein